MYGNVADTASLSVGVANIHIVGWLFIRDIGVAATVNQGVLCKGNVANTEYRIITSNTSGKMRLRWACRDVANTVTNEVATPILRVGVWNFFDCYYDLSNSLMSAGIDDSTQRFTTAMTGGVWDSTFDFEMNRFSAANNGLHRLTRIGMWDRILTAGERLILYNNGVPQLYEQVKQRMAVDTGLRAWYNLTQDFNDSSANANNLTNNNNCYFING